MRQLQKKLKSGTVDLDDPFELFIAATTIRYCYYSETHKILGSTYGMCVLQVRVQCVCIYMFVKGVSVSPLVRSMASFVCARACMHACLHRLYMRPLR